MRNVILTSHASPADAVVLTAAVRDLHKCYPGRFRTDVRTSHDSLWENNPYVVHLNGAASNAEVISCISAPLRDRNRIAEHAIHNLIGFLNQRLGLHIRTTALKGDIHLSDAERLWRSQVAEIVGDDIPYWVVVTGDDNHNTVAAWDNHRFQQVVDHFAGQVQFVQAGQLDHSRLKRVLDLRGATDPRQLIRLIYHAQGVLCPATVHMHLAAAIEVKGNPAGSRPCVVVAGARDPVHWGAYSHHHYIHTVGTLPCCVEGGCGKSRISALRDGKKTDRCEDVCVDVVQKRIARCMHLISAQDVIQRIEAYFRMARLQPLPRKQGGRLRKLLDFGRKVEWKADRIEAASFRRASEEYIRSIPRYPRTFRGRGIVICGGARYLACAWVCIRMLRKLGCRLPIELWHLGHEEMDRQFASLVKPFRVTCVDALKMRRRHPARELSGWPLKAYALKHSRFREILLLDADNVPVVNPEFLFEARPYKQCGAIFWPDIRPGIKPEVWDVFGTPYRQEPEFESGQIVVDKARCWRPLSLALWYNEHPDFYYRHVLGDKDTFHLAFRKLEKAFAFVSTPVKQLSGTMCQHDFDGKRVFQHRNLHKWRLSRDNARVPGFFFEEECLQFLEDLRCKWLTPPPALLIPDNAPKTDLLEAYSDELVATTYEYQRVGYDARRMSFNRDGTIGFGSAEIEKYWYVTHCNGKTWLEILSDKQVICRLTRDRDGNWHGKWNFYERMPIKLRKEIAVVANGRIADAELTKARRRILFRAPLNGYTGYGLHANQIVTDLQKLGYEFSIRAIDINETFAPIPDNVRKAIICHEHPSEWELVLCPPGFGPNRGKRTVHFTMWESTRFPPHSIGNFNRCESVIVPSQWNASCLCSSGVQRPIHIVPLGIKTDIFKFAPMSKQGLCVFGTAGRLESGGTRKGINLIIDAFKKAFPAESDVRLYVKIFPDCDVPFEKDQRIQFNREYLSELQMAKWFRSLTCFVSGARGEGWGLMQHQALATGRPIIAARFGGMGEFFNHTMGYPLDFQLVPAEDLYTGCGLWAEPDERHLIHLMRRVRRKREEARQLGLNATLWASKFTWQESSRKLWRVLQRIGMIS